jgi:hypothetical protein
MSGRHINNRQIDVDVSNHSQYLFIYIYIYIYIYLYKLEELNQLELQVRIGCGNSISFKIITIFLVARVLQTHYLFVLKLPILFLHSVDNPRISSLRSGHVGPSTRMSRAGPTLGLILRASPMLGKKYVD